MYSKGSVNNVCLPVGLYIDVSDIIHNTCVVIGIPQHTAAKPRKMCIHVDCISPGFALPTALHLILRLAQFSLSHMNSCLLNNCQMHKRKNIMICNGKVRKTLGKSRKCAKRGSFKSPRCSLAKYFTYHTVNELHQSLGY